MKIFLTSDIVKGPDADAKYLNDVANILKANDHEVTVFLPIDPNSHISGMKAAPQDSFVFNFYGGACAGTIYEMGTDWFVKERGTRNIMILFREGSRDIRELDFLERAHDDDFSAASFTGLANPDQYLYEHGYGFDYVTDVTNAASVILNVVGRKVIKVVTGSDLSATTGSVPLAVFTDMTSRFNAYKAANGKEPDIIYLKSGGGDYVSKSKYIDMLTRFNAYVAANGIEPTIIYFQKPVPPARVVGVLQARLESFLGQFNSFTEFYNKCKGRGYAYYYDDIKTLEQEIVALQNKTGMNCSDAAQLFATLAQEMGYNVAFEHIICQSSGGHIRLKISLKEFGDLGADSRNWFRVDPAACLSVGSQYNIGDVWCSNGTRVGITKMDGAWIGEYLGWLLTDDGRT